MKKEPTPLTRLELDIQHSIALHIGALEFLQTYRDKLEKLDLRFNYYGTNIDFDQLKRPDALKALKAFPGKWDKKPGYDGGIIYTSRETFGGRTIRLFNAEPPPSCKIVETIQWVKVPARREKVVTRSVVCASLE